MYNFVREQKRVQFPNVLKLANIYLKTIAKRHWLEQNGCRKLKKT